MCVFFLRPIFGQSPRFLVVSNGWGEFCPHLHPLKTNMDAKNDGLEKVVPSKIWPFLDFCGVLVETISFLAFQEAEMKVLAGIRLLFLGCDTQRKIYPRAPCQSNVSKSTFGPKNGSSLPTAANSTADGSEKQR